jgi:HAMP domain-containing protein
VLISVLRRVRDLMAATKQLAAGNLKARTRLPYGASELGHLARTFDELAKALEQRAQMPRWPRPRFKSSTSGKVPSMRSAQR